MRKIIYTAALLLSLSTASLADGRQELTINGQTVAATVTRIAFDGDNVIITFADGTTTEADMETVVLNMDYSTITAIGSLQEPVGRMLDISGLQPGTVVSIYDAQGKLVATTTAKDARQTLSMRKLKGGVYVLKAGDSIVKFIKR